MANRKESWISALFDIRKSEGKIIVFLLALSFLSGVSFVFYITSTITLFLSKFESQSLAIAYILSGIVGYVTWYLFYLNQERFKFINICILGYVVLLAVIIALLGLCSYLPNKWWYMLLFAWFRFFAYLNAISFWGIATRLLDIQQGKRLFGLIGIGEVLSQILGYFSIPLIINLYGLQALYTISILFLIILILLVIASQYLMSFKLDEKKNTTDNKEESPEFSISKRYQVFMFIASLLPIFGFYFIDYIFLTEADNQGFTTVGLAKFLGLFFGTIAIVELLIKLFVSGKFLNRYGLKMGINILPIILVVTASITCLFLFLPDFTIIIFSLIALTKLLNRVLQYSFNEPAFQILYYPIPSNQKFKLRNLLEGVSKASGVILAGFLIMALNYFFDDKMTLPNILLVLILIFWIVINNKLYKEYLIMLQRFVKTNFYVSPNTKPIQVDLNVLQNLDEINLTQGALYKLHSSTELETYLSYDRRIEEKNIHENLQFKNDIASFVLSSTLPIESFINWVRKVQGLNTALINRYEQVDLMSQFKILNILSASSEEGNLFLEQQLASHNLYLQYLSSSLLFNNKYKFNIKDQEKGRYYIDQIVENILWCYASIVDIESDNKSNSIIEELNNNIEILMHSLFNILSLIYDRSLVLQIKDLTFSDSQDTNQVLARELLENFFDEEIKTKISFIFNGLSYDQNLKLMQSMHPQNNLTVTERLKDIFMKDYRFVPIYIKLLALKRYRLLEPKEYAFLLKAAQQNEHSEISRFAKRLEKDNGDSSISFKGIDADIRSSYLKKINYSLLFEIIGETKLIQSETFISEDSISLLPLTNESKLKNIKIHPSKENSTLIELKENSIISSNDSNITLGFIKMDEEFIKLMIKKLI